MNPNLVNFIYLIAGVLFILGIKGLTKPKTAVRGNMLSALGMLLAVVVTLLSIASRGLCLYYRRSDSGYGRWRGNGSARSDDLYAANGCIAEWLSVVVRPLPIAAG